MLTYLIQKVRLRKRIHLFEFQDQLNQELRALGSDKSWLHSQIESRGNTMQEVSPRQGITRRKTCEY